MEKIQSEILELKSQIQALQQERAMLTNNHVELSENDSHLAIVEAYRRQARENAQLSAELKGIDDAISFLEKQIQQRKNMDILKFEKLLVQTMFVEKD